MKIKDRIQIKVVCLFLFVIALFSFNFNVNAEGNANNNIRYVKEVAPISGNSSASYVDCNIKVFIKKETCKDGKCDIYSDQGLNMKIGTISTNYLVYKLSVAKQTCTGRIDGQRKVNNNTASSNFPMGGKLSCGSRVYVSSCYGSEPNKYCYTKSDRSNYLISGKIKASSLTDVDSALNCNGSSNNTSSSSNNNSSTNSSNSKTTVYIKKISKISSFNSSLSSNFLAYTDCSNTYGPGGVSYEVETSCLNDSKKNSCNLYYGSTNIGSVSKTSFTTNKSEAAEECKIQSSGSGRKGYISNTYKVIESKRSYSCGNEVYFTGCDDNYCYIKKSSNDNYIYAVVTKSSKTDVKYCGAPDDNEDDEDVNNNNNNNNNENDTNNNSSNIDSSKKNINAVRWLSKTYNDLVCGTPVYIHSCYNVGDNKVCDYANISDITKIVANISSSYLTNDIVTVMECGTTTKGSRYPIVSGTLSDGKTKYNCGDELYITNCDTNTCYIGGINGNISSKYYGTIDSDKLKSDVTYTASHCNSSTNNVKNEESHEVDIYNNVDENVNNEGLKDVVLKKCSNEKKSNQKVAAIYDFCYNRKELSDIKALENKIKDYYLCDEKNGYKFDSTYFYPLDGGGCDDKTGYCTRPFAVRCSKDSGNVKPIMSVTSGIVNNAGIGVINVKATAMQGDIVGYYYSEKKVTPTHIDVGWKQVNSGNFTIEHSAGTIYIWVKDSYGNISNSITATVYDTVNSNNTVKQLQIKDNNGRTINPNNSVSYNNKISSNKYAMMSNNLNKDSKVLAAGFNPFDMEYEMEVDSPTVSVYATLTSSDSNYVSGYEPRTVNLDFGLNTVLIKIQDKEGKIRTYTILVTRVDNRNSDNTLRDIKLSEGEITFNANVTDYKIEISKNTKSINVESVIASDKASYVNGYEDGIVNITGDTTVKLIKVKSQTGSTRTYVLTFVKKGTDVITEESLMLEHLSIPGVYVPFEESVANYSISVDYETSYINIRTSLKDETSTVKFRSKRKSDSSYVEGSMSGVLLDVGENFFEITVKNKKGETSTYRFTIIRKEVGLGISKDNTLKDLKVLGYDIDFKPEKKEYVVKIKQEKSLVITAVPNSNRAEVFIRGNDELTGYSTVRVKVVAENGEYETYSIDIKKDPFNKVIEILAIVFGAVFILGGSVIIVARKRTKSNKEYFEE